MSSRTIAALCAVAIAAALYVGHLNAAGGSTTPSLLGYTVQAVAADGATINQPQDNQWYAPGDVHLTVQPGTWRLSYRACVYVSRNRNPDGSWDFGTVGAIATLSTLTAGEADPAFRDFYRVGGSNRNAALVLGAEKVVVVRRPTVWHLLVKQSEGGMGQLQIAAGNENCPPTVIRAERVA